VSEKRNLERPKIFHISFFISHWSFRIEGLTNKLRPHLELGLVSRKMGLVTPQRYNCPIQIDGVEQRISGMTNEK
jgi:hypothetical protein